MAVWSLIYGKNNAKILPNSVNDELLKNLNSIEFDAVEMINCSIEALSNESKFAINSYESDDSGLIQFLLSLNEDDYIKRIQELGIPNIDKQNLKKCFIEKSTKFYNDRKNELQTLKYSVIPYIKSNGWEANNNILVLKFGEEQNDLNFRIILLNDIVEIIGPFRIFSHYYTFQKSISSFHRLKFHNFFIELLRVFKSDIIIYANEMSGFDFENPNLNYKMLKKQLDFLKTSSDTINNIEKCYYEKI